LIVVDGVVVDGVVVDGVKDKWYGVLPNRIPDLLAISGESADSIPGVPGFGNKDAGNIIGTYGSLQEILKKAENADANPKLKAIKMHEETILKNRELFTLRTDVQVPDLTTHAIRPIHEENFLKLMRKEGFKSVGAQFESDGKAKLPYIESG